MATGERIGVMNCWSCNKEVPVKKTPGGNLSAPCTWCDFMHYAKPGTQHFKNLHADVRLDPNDAPPPAPDKTPAPPAKSGVKYPHMR